MLLVSLLVSASSFTLRDGEGALAGIVGVAPIPGLEGVGAIWMYGTKLIENRSVTFLRNSRPALQLLHSHFPTLINIADARNEVHLKWLRWLGFHFIRKVDDFGPGKVPVIEFARIDNSV